MVKLASHVADNSPSDMLKCGTERELRDNVGEIGNGGGGVLLRRKAALTMNNVIKANRSNVSHLRQ